MPHSTPSERFASSAFVEGHVCHLCHIAAASRRRGPPPLRFNAKRTEATGCVPHRAIRLYARWCSPRQETILRRWDFMHTLNRAWSSSLRVRRLSNNTPLPRTKSWRWPHRSRPSPPPHHSAAIATKKSRRSGSPEEKQEGKKWFFEKNRRAVLKMHDDHGRCRYWRARRPRPRPHRRRIRQQIVKAALSYENSPFTTSAQDSMRVLQAPLCRRAEAAEKALRLARKRIAGKGQLRHFRGRCWPARDSWRM